MYDAGSYNQRVEIVAQATAVHAGVSAALDAALGNGKGKLLTKFRDSMLKDLDNPSSKKPVMSERAAQFFGGLPVVKGKPHGNH